MQTLEEGLPHSRCPPSTKNLANEILRPPSIRRALQKRQVSTRRLKFESAPYRSATNLWILPAPHGSIQAHPKRFVSRLGLQSALDRFECGETGAASVEGPPSGTPF